MAIDVRRRKFIAVLSGALAGRAIPANAQQAARMRTVGVLMGFANDAETQARITAFEQGLKAEGWSVGQNLRIEYRYAEGDSARMQALAKELVELKPDCILGHSTPVVTALMQATRTIPIVFVSVSDPIGSGFVASMARPGGNITGFTVLHASIAGKYLSMLKEMVPQLARVAIMYNPNSAPAAGTFFFTPFIGAATKFKVRPITAEVHDPSEIESTIAKLGSQSRSGLIVVPDNFMRVHREAYHLAHRAVSHSGNLPLSVLCRGGGPRVVRRGCHRPVPARIGVREPHSPRRQAGGSSGASTDEIRACDQSQDGEGSRPRDPEDTACRRRAGDRVKRREFIGLVGGAAAWPLTASAQQAGGKIVTIGILAIEPWPPIDTFRQALDDLGYIEGKNVRFEYRYAKGHNERLPELANDLVGLNVDVILTWGTDAVLAAKQATTTIPIVMGTIGDPLGIGIVTNLAHPGGNVTGSSSRAAELEAKRLQLLKEVVPGLSRVAILFNPTNHYMPLALQSARKGAQMLHVSLAVYEVHDTTTLDAAFVTLTKDRPDALMVPADTFLVSQRSRIAQFAIENKLPSVYTFREYIEAGGLIAYTPNYDDLFRRAASYVDKILKGAKPGELPIEAADEVSSIDQPQDCSSARPHAAA